MLRAFVMGLEGCPTLYWTDMGWGRGPPCGAHGWAVSEGGRHMECLGTEWSHVPKASRVWRKTVMDSVIDQGNGVEDEMGRRGWSSPR